MGAGVSIEGSVARIEGSPLFRRASRFGSGDGLSSPDPKGGPLELDCGESGLCMRMFAPIAALLALETRLTGHGSILRRPMTMAEEPLNGLGASCRSTAGLPPLLIRGPLSGGEVEIDAGASSQLLTGLLVALPLASGDSVLSVKNAVSRGYLDLTIETCAAFGVSIERDSSFSRFIIRGDQVYKAMDFTAEGDWSGAAFLVAAAALSAGEKGLKILGLSADSKQPDRAMVEAAAAAGVPLRFEGDALVVHRGSLRPFAFDATDCPDLFPPLAALAAACPGESVLRGTSRLRNKESDRAASIAAFVSALGGTVRLSGDEMVVRGGNLRGGVVDSCGDHRIAMAAAVAALAAEGPVTVLGAECVTKSWPGFFEDLASVTV